MVRKYIFNITPGPILMVRYYRYERRFGRGAYANLCVSQAMQADLRLNWKIECVTDNDMLCLYSTTI